MGWLGGRRNTGFQMSSSRRVPHFSSRRRRSRRTAIVAVLVILVALGVLWVLAGTPTAWFRGGP